MSFHRLFTGSLLATCTASSLICFSAHAQSVQESVDVSTPWRFQVTPYLWMAGLEGNVRPVQRSPTLNVDKSFSEIMDSLDAAVFVTGAARYGRYVIHGDFSHVTTSDGAPLPLGLSAKVRVRQTSMTLAGGYNWMPSESSNIDLMAGMRGWKIGVKGRIPGRVSVRSDTSFVDPIVAVRWRYDISPRWSTLLYADVGGFGVGSKSTWQLWGTVNYQVSDNMHLSLGYRDLSVDYEDKGKVLDFRQSGPLLGLTYMF